MSTGIQCLAATESLVQFFVHKLNVQKLEDNSLTTQFAELLQRMWNGQYSVVNPVKFKQALGTHHPQFKDCSQVGKLRVIFEFLFISCFVLIYIIIIA